MTAKLKELSVRRCFFFFRFLLFYYKRQRRARRPACAGSSIFPTREFAYFFRTRHSVGRFCAHRLRCRTETITTRSFDFSVPLSHTSISFGVSGTLKQKKTNVTTRLGRKTYIYTDVVSNDFESDAARFYRPPEYTTSMTEPQSKNVEVSR